MLYYKEYGTEHPEVIVFLHGLGGNLEHWQAQRELADTYRLLFIDLKGFGKSNPVPPFSIQEQAASVLELLTYLHIPIAHFVGLSMGGLVVQEIYKQQRVRVSSLTLVSSFPTIPANLKASFTKGSIDNIRENKTKGMIERTLHQPANPLHITAIKKGTHFTKQSYIESAEACLSADYSALLPTITVPVFVIAGNQDPILPTTVALSFFEAIPTASLALLDACGHMCNIEQTDAFNAHLRSFLSS